MKPLLEVESLSVSYDGQQHALRGLSLHVSPGEVVGVMGPNGSGKSTALKAIVGALDVESGTIELHSEDPPVYIPQRASIDWDFPITVREVVKQGRIPTLGWFRWLSDEDHSRIDAALEAVGLSELGDRQIGELSGGQQQRTFLARAIAQDGDLYLLDEPFQGVDATTQQAVVSVIESLRAAGKGIIVVHHDLSTAHAYFDRIVLLNTRCVAAGPPAEALTAENLKEAYGGRVAIVERAQP